MINIFDKINNWTYNHVRKPISHFGGKIFTRISSFFTRNTPLDKGTQTINPLIPMNATGDNFSKEKALRAYYIGGYKTLCNCFDKDSSAEVLQTTRNSFTHLLQRINDESKLPVKAKNSLVSKINSTLKEIDYIFEQSTTIKGKSPIINRDYEGVSTISVLRQQNIDLQGRNTKLQEYLTTKSTDYNLIKKEYDTFKETMANLNQGLSSTSNVDTSIKKSGNIAQIKALKEEITNLLS